MNHELIVSETIQIDTSKERMWDVLTNPEIIKEYLYGTDTITDWKVGSEIIFQGEFDGHQYKDKGIVESINLNQSLSYWYWSGFSGIDDLKENYSLVSYSIDEVSDSEVKFTWTQKGFSSSEGFEHSQKGMEALLNTIKLIAEKN
jgi:uncharacterized protein YndB with AHSA1/START domain